MKASWKRWLVAAAGSVFICVLSFAYLNRDGCWLYWRGSTGITIFFLLAAWIFLLFGLHWRGRVLLLLALFGVVLVWPTDIFWVHHAAAESGAVAGLRSLRSALENARTLQPTNGYLQALPITQQSSILHTDSFHPAYRYDYLPTRSPEGKVFEYMIRATPTRPDCGCCIRSFTILNDGRIYYTLEQRPATMLDSLLQ